jgi:sugar phosphate isomerase/epimerase
MTYRPGMQTDQIALQLYTVRRLAADDLPGTLAAVAAAGYRSVEVAGLPETGATVLARLLADNGLAAIACHQSIESLRGDWEAVADRLAAIGCARAIVPWLPEGERQDIDGVRRFAADVAGFAGRLAERGVRVGYHNHSFEFAPLEDTTVWAILLAQLPPAVEIELDVFWAAVGGRDPVAEIGALGDSVKLLHMKDRAPGLEPHDAPAGEGDLPFPAIVGAGRAAGVDWYIVEQDEPGDAIADIRRARRYLETMAD